MEPRQLYSERENYLNQEYGIRSWLLTTDHKRIALLYLVSITFFFFVGGFFALLIRLELLTPAGDLVQADTYNKLFTMHGQVMVFFFLIPSIPAVLGNFLVPLDDRRQGPGLSAHQSAELVSLHNCWGHLCPLHSHWRRRHRLDFLHALQHRFQQYQGDRSGNCDFHRRILLHPYGPELCGHHSPNASAGNDMVALAAIYLGTLRNQHHPVARNAGTGDYAAAGGIRTRFQSGNLRSQPAAATPSCSSICSGSIPTPRFTS